MLIRNWDFLEVAEKKLCQFSLSSDDLCRCLTKQCMGWYDDGDGGTCLLIPSVEKDDDE